MSKTIHSLLAGYEITLSTADSSASLHMADNPAIGANISSGSVTYGPYYYDTQWVSSGGTITVAQTEREIGDIQGISIDASSSVYGNIYESGTIKENGLYLCETGIVVAKNGALYNYDNERLSPDMNNDFGVALAGDFIVDSTITPNPSDEAIIQYFGTVTPALFLDYYWYAENSGYDAESNPNAKTLISTERELIPTYAGDYFIEIYGRNDYGVSTKKVVRTGGSFTVTEE